jgi:hypothetical protein
LSFEATTRRSATSSPSSRVAIASMTAPISRNVVNSPVRNGLVMTFSSTSSEPGTISAAIIGNAADDGSAGTTTFAGSSSGWPWSTMRRPCSPCGLVTILAPKCLSMRSV